MFTEDFQVDFMKRYHAVFDELKRDFLVGEMVWNFADFMTAPSECNILVSNSSGREKDRHCCKIKKITACDTGYCCYVGRKINITHVRQCISSLPSHIFHRISAAAVPQRTILYRLFCHFVSGITRVVGNKKGILTRQREPKAAGHLMRNRYWTMINGSLPDSLRHSQPALVFGSSSVRSVDTL